MNYFLFLSFGFAVKVVDMVPLGPVFIDMFEMTCGIAKTSHPGSCDFGSTNWKPARITSLSTAVKVCQGAGKRLSTREEWMAAATNLGRNQMTTLIGDSLKHPNGDWKPHVAPAGKSGNAISPFDFASLGIDAIGTVGLTGNRAEWAVSQNQAYICGGAYDENPLPLDQMCRTANSGDEATVRCVIEKDQVEAVSYSNVVTGELLAYVKSLPQQVFQNELGDNRFIGDNPFSRGKNPSDPSRLDPQSPFYLDRY